MTRYEAQQLAEKASPEDIIQMLLNAQNNIKDWTIPSRPNKGLSLGVNFNIFSKCTWNDKTHILAKINAIWSFGEYLPGYRKQLKEKPKSFKTAHQEPIFFIDKKEE